MSDHIAAADAATEPNKYAGFLARQNHQRDPWRGVGVKCLCGKVFDLDADHALHQVDEILRATLAAADAHLPTVEQIAEAFAQSEAVGLRWEQIPPMTKQAYMSGARAIRSLFGGGG